MKILHLTILYFLNNAILPNYFLKNPFEEETQESKTTQSSLNNNTGDNPSAEITNRLYPSSLRKMSEYMKDYVVKNLDNIVNPTIDHCCSVKNIPTNYNDTNTSNAMEKEIMALKVNNTCELTEFPPSKTVVRNRWVYTIKTNNTNNEQFKARFVAKGY